MMMSHKLQLVAIMASIGLSPLANADFSFPGSACEIKNPGNAHTKTTYFRNDASTVTEVVCPLVGSFDYSSTLWTVRVKSSGSATPLECRWVNVRAPNSTGGETLEQGTPVSTTSTAQTTLSLGWVPPYSNAVAYCKLPPLVGTAKAHIYTYQTESLPH